MAIFVRCENENCKKETSPDEADDLWIKIHAPMNHRTPRSAIGEITSHACSWPCALMVCKKKAGEIEPARPSPSPPRRD